MPTIFLPLYGASATISTQKETTTSANDMHRSLYSVLTTCLPDRQAHDSRSSTPGSYLACIGFDGTRKTKELDDFHRDWPNIIVADDTTIKTVDDKWAQLGIGSFIPSPSLKFKDQLYGKEAAVS